jgi:hypothetical protein
LGNPALQEPQILVVLQRRDARDNDRKTPNKKGANYVMSNCFVDLLTSDYPDSLHKFVPAFLQNFVPSPKTGIEACKRRILVALGRTAHRRMTLRTGSIGENTAWGARHDLEHGSLVDERGCQDKKAYVGSEL